MREVLNQLGNRLMGFQFFVVSQRPNLASGLLADVGIRIKQQRTQVIRDLRLPGYRADTSRARQRRQSLCYTRKPFGRLSLCLAMKSARMSRAFRAHGS